MLSLLNVETIIRGVYEYLDDSAEAKHTTAPDQDTLQRILNSVKAENTVAISHDDDAKLHQELYHALVHLHKTQEPLPANITVAGQEFVIHKNLPTLIKLLYLQASKNSYFPDTEKEQQRYTMLEWMGNFYNKKSPSPEQLDLHYKRTPYRTIEKGALPVLLNDKTTFTQSRPNGEVVPIVCRHFSAQVIDDIENDRQHGKVNWDHYNDKDSVRKHVTIETESRFATLKQNASRYDLIENDRLGEHIQACFQNMREMPQPKEGDKIKRLMLMSTNHAMVIRLRIKMVSGKPIYVLSFYDVNVGSNKTMRCRTDDLSAFKTHTLKLYIDGAHKGGTVYDYYFKNNSPITMIIDCEVSNSPQITKQLSSPGPLCITPTYIFFLLDCNLSIDLAQLEDKLSEIGQKSPEDLLRLLAGKSSAGMPGLYMAMQNGHTDVVRVFAKLLEKCIPLLQNHLEHVIDLLAAKDIDGTSGLYIAMQSGHTDVVRVFVKLLEKCIPLLQNHPRQVIDLLAAKCEDGISGLHIAMNKGHSDIVRVFAELPEKFTPLLQKYPEQVIDLLAAKDIDGTSGLFLAMQNGHTDVVRAFITLLEKCIPLLQNHPKQVIELLAAKCDDGLSGLHMGMHAGHSDILRALTELPEKFTPLLQQYPEQVIDLLATKFNGGTSGLYMAIHKGHIDTVHAFGELVQKIIPFLPNHLNQIIQLLDVKTPDNPFWLKITQNRDEMISAHEKIISRLSENEQSKLLEQLNDDMLG